MQKEAKYDLHLSAAIDNFDFLSAASKLRAPASCGVGSGFYGWCRQRSIGVCRGRADPELGSALLWAEGML